MSPGTYLTLRRQAAGLSIDDVAAKVRTDPPVGEVDRAGWIRRIEEDRVLPTFDAVHALGWLFPFSRPVLSRLIDLHRHDEAAESDAPRICTQCGCSEHDACRTDDSRGCAWSGPDTCTRCVPAPTKPSTEEAA